MSPYIMWHVIKIWTTGHSNIMVNFTLLDIGNVDCIIDAGMYTLSWTNVYSLNKVGYFDNCPVCIPDIYKWFSFAWLKIDCLIFLVLPLSLSMSMNYQQQFLFSCLPFFASPFRYLTILKCTILPTILPTIKCNTIGSNFACYAYSYSASLYNMSVVLSTMHIIPIHISLDRDQYAQICLSRLFNSLV